MTCSENVTSGKAQSIEEAVLAAMMSLGKSDWGKNNKICFSKKSGFSLIGEAEALAYPHFALGLAHLQPGLC